MIAKLEFNLPDDSDEHRAAFEGMRARLALHDVAEQLRERIKYGIPSNVKTIEDAYQGIREMFYDVLDQHDISLEW